MKRDAVKKVLSYGTLQAIVENTILKMPELKDADQAAVKAHIFDGLYKRANQQTTKPTTVR